MSTNNKTKTVTSTQTFESKKKPVSIKDGFLTNHSDVQIVIDGVGALPKGVNVPIPPKMLDLLLQDEQGLNSLNITIGYIADKKKSKEQTK